MPTVVNKRTHTPTDRDIYIGRPSPLGNPFSHLEGTLAEFRVATRAEAVHRYRGWLVQKIEALDPAVLDALRAIKNHSVLVCWCKPASCHGDVIIDVLRKLPKGVLHG